MFSVRADIVCLEPVNESDPAPRLPRSPVIYLGQSANNMLVLFDLERREKVRAREEEIEKRDIRAPERVPVRIPASNVMVRVASLIDSSRKYVVPVTLTKPSRRHFEGKWDC
jgi:hypothetical protein